MASAADRLVQHIRTLVKPAHRMTDTDGQLLGRWADQIRENLPGLREKTSPSSAARRGNPTRKQRDGIAKVKPESGS